MSTATGKGNALLLGAEPRAHLLPPEVHERARAQSMRKSLGFVVALAFVVAVMAYGAAFFFAVQAEAQLAAAQKTTEAMRIEEETYAEATRVANMLVLAETAQALAVSTELDWPDLIDEITLYLPAGTIIESGTMQSKVVWDEADTLKPQGPLRSPRVATVVLVLQSAVLLDTTQLVRNLAGLEGFADASTDTVVRNDTVFTTTVTLNLNEDALHNRYDAEAEATN